MSGEGCEAGGQSVCLLPVFRSRNVGLCLCDCLCLTWCVNAFQTESLSVAKMFSCCSVFVNNIIYIHVSCCSVKFMTRVIANLFYQDGSLQLWDTKRPFVSIKD